MKKLIFLILLLLLACTGLQAQKKPCFKVYDVDTQREVSAFCVGQKIKIVNCEAVSPTTIQYYDYDARDGVPFRPGDTVNTHTFTQAGTYRISFLPVDQNSSQSDSTSKGFAVLPRPKPRFRAVGCSQGNVKVTITDQNYHSFLVDFGGGATQTLARGGTATHRFAPGQPLRIRVSARYNQALCSESADTTVRELPLPPQPLLAKVQVPLPTADGRISLDLEQLHPGYFYVIERQSGAGFAPVDTLKNPASAQTTTMLTRINASGPVCFRVRVTDPCGTAQLPVSNTLCSLPVTISTSQQITLSWPAYPEPGQLTGYQLYRNGKPYRELPKDQRSFRDEQVSCGQQYCYELLALLGNGTRSVSNNPCAAVTTGAPPAPPYLSSSFTPDNQVRIVLQVPANQVISLITYRKSVNSGGFSDLGQGTALTFDDNSFNQNSVACYQAVYRDSCGQTSPVSNQTCPIVLKADQQPDNTVLLSWSSYVGFPPGTVRYLVEQVDASGAVLSAVPVSGNTYTDALPTPARQKIYYRIQGLSAGQPPTYSNTESITFEAIAQIPTAFTPNGDNLNDVFEVKGRFIQHTRLTIYDRWGQIIFQSDGQGWDGRIKGKPAPTGTYPYLVSWKDEHGRTWQKNGIVNLLR